jgi:biopolymer transport protein ExbB
LADTIEGGGIIGIVILSIGGVAVLLIILRIINLVRVSRKNDKLLDAVVARVKEGDLGEALNQAATLPAAMGRVIRSTLQGLRSDPSSVEDVISESVLNEQPLLERYRSALSVFAAVAPLLGLLGTVTGMISTFDVITQYGTGDPQLLSGGISEALITTELGLAVAIPTLLIGNLLASWADRITSNLEVSALRIVNVHGGFEGAASMAG